MTQQCTLHALSWQLGGHLKRKHRLTFASLHMHFTCPEPSGNGAADTRISGLYLNRYTCMRAYRVGVGTLIRGLFCLRRCYSLLHIDRSLGSLAESGLCLHEGKHAKRHTVGTVRSTVHCTPRCRSLRQQRSAMAAHLPTLGEVFSFSPPSVPPSPGRQW